MTTNQARASLKAAQRAYIVAVASADDTLIARAHRALNAALDQFGAACKLQACKLQA